MSEFAMSINVSMIYLAAAAIIIFVAGVLATRKIPRLRKRKQMLIIVAIISLIAVLILWHFVGVMSRPHEETEEEAPESTG